MALRKPTKTVMPQIVQEGVEGNCLVPFFLREGKPTFIRVFEAP